MVTDRATRDAAFERHVVPEIEVLLRVARSLTGSAHEAEDVVQETLVRAYRAIDRFDGAHPRAWLLTILRNAHRNRHRRRRPELLRDPDAAAVSQRFAAAEDDPAAEAVRGAFDSAVRDAFEALGPQFRQTVELVDIDGLSCEEAARILDVAPGTVMSRLHRARRRMREHLDRAGVDPKEDS